MPSIVQGTPDNVNFLGQNGFQLTLLRLPHVVYFTQRTELPSLDIPAAITSSPFSHLPKPGDRISWAPWTLTFKIDENLKNYYEIYHWIREIGHPVSLTETSTAVTAPWHLEAKGAARAAAFMTDGTLTILSSSKNPIASVIFKDMFPTALSGLNFELTAETVNYAEATVTFAYRMYELKPGTSR